MCTTLKVPYQSQRDAEGNASDRWWHMCNSSTHAMLAEFLKPGCLSKPAKKKKLQIDDYYLTTLVDATGLETENHNAHTQALETLGIESYWSYALGFEDATRSLNAGIPFACGVAHKGSVWAPEGGHIILAIGEDDAGWTVHDPWGAGFSYQQWNGAGVYYPREHSLRNRWLLDGPNAGWGRIVTAIDGKPTGL